MPRTAHLCLRGPLCLEWLPCHLLHPTDSVPSFKASSGGTSPGKPAQIPPHRGTVQLLWDLTRCHQELSLLPCTFLFLSRSPSDPPSSFTLSPNRTGHPFILCCVYGCCSPACAVCSSALGLGSGWPLPLQCPPLTWWHNHTHPCRPSPSVSCKPSLSPRVPCMYIGRLWTAPASELAAPVALFCLGSDVSLPRGGTCPLSHAWVPEPAGGGRGRLGLGLGGQKWTLLLLAPRRAGPCAGHLSTSPVAPSQRPGGRAWEQAPLQRRELSPPRLPGPPAPPGSAQSTSDRGPALSCSGA